MYMFFGTKINLPAAAFLHSSHAIACHRLPDMYIFPNIMPGIIRGT